MKRLMLALIWMAFACAGLSARGEVAGRVLLAAGDAVAVRAGKALPLAPGMMIEDKDTLRTGTASSLQVRFTDASIMSLRENSELAIEEYRFSGRPGGQENAFYRLVKGGLRTVTGFIGRTRHENYRIDSITATIGIRGTHFALMSCQSGSCLNADGSKAKDGLYGGVTDGIVAATTKVGEFRFGAGETFLAPGIDSPVEKLIGPPVFLSDRLEGQKRSGSKQADSGSASSTASEAASGTTTSASAEGSATSSSGSEQTAAGGIQADSRANTAPAPLPQLQVVTTEDLTPQGNPVVLPPANGFVVVYPYTASNAELAFDDKTTMTFNSSNHLTAYGTQGTFPAGSLSGGAIVDTGSLTLSNGQVVAYGRWTGNTMVTASDGTTYTAVPVLFGTATGLNEQGSTTALPISGTATYAYKGGPSLVDAGGNTGTVTSSSLTIDFTLARASLSLAASFPGVGADFSLSGTAKPNTTAHKGDFGGTLSGSCNGSGCGTAASQSGFFELGLAGANGYEFAAAGGSFTGTQASGRVAFLNTYLNDSFTAGPPRQSVLLAHASASGGNHGPLAQPNDTLTFSGGLLTAYQSDNANSAIPSGNLNTGTVVETGTVALTDGGTMNWGRWTGSTVQVLAQPSNTLVNPPTGVPYIRGDHTNTLPTSGSFTYSYAGGPNPANSLGNVGTFNGGAFSVAFGATSSISVATTSPLSLTVGGVSYSVNSICGGSCTFGPAPEVTASLSGTCSGGACGSTGSPLNGTLVGRFMGPQAGGFATAGNINSTSGAPTVSFAAGFKR